MKPRVATVPARRKSSVPEAEAVRPRGSNGIVRSPKPSKSPPEHEALGLSADRMREMFEVMLLARIIDERQWILNRQGIEAFHISCQGHEGSGVGSAFALDLERDTMVPYYRSLAAVLAFGMTPY